MLTRSGAEIHVDLSGDDGVVHKLHRPGTDPRQLTVRLRVATESQALLSPLSTEPVDVGGRWRSSWPYVETVVPQPEFLPWAEAGGLLARLHREEPGQQPTRLRPRQRFGLRHNGFHVGPTATPATADINRFRRQR